MSLLFRLRSSVATGVFDFARRLPGLGRARAGEITALRAQRDDAVRGQRWSDALGAQHRLASLVPAAERASEMEWLAVVHYELGRAALQARQTTQAVTHLRNSLRADRRFVPASLALGEAHDAAGDHREAVRVWERAADVVPTLPILARLERAYRGDERPGQMIALYERAVVTAPGDLGLAVALGRVYFELEMLDEAAEQFEKIEVRAPELALVHAFLGAIFERRGQTREALDEYRRTLRLTHGFEWPYRCGACGVTAPAWRDRCEACGRWNTL
jgi:lipopolysaccharide biosynthesis regulator YciM